MVSEVQIQLHLQKAHQPSICLMFSVQVQGRRELGRGAQGDREDLGG